VTILLTGGSGQLGTELQRLGDYVAPSHQEMDITDPRTVKECLQKLLPRLIVHAAAYTNTLGADLDTDEMVTCWRTNVLGTRTLAHLATCPIIYISSEAVIHPYSIYVLSKLKGEFEIATSHYGYRIIRTSFRPDPFPYPKAFDDMWTLADSTPVIAQLIQDLVNSGKTLNDIIYVGTGAKTMYELAKRSRPDVQPCPRLDAHSFLPSLEELRSI
jgi:dTDP-4-dehydrorhamnose reductase